MADPISEPTIVPISPAVAEAMNEGARKDDEAPREPVTSYHADHLRHDFPLARKSRNLSLNQIEPRWRPQERTLQVITSAR